MIDFSKRSSYKEYFSKELVKQTIVLVTLPGTTGSEKIFERRAVGLELENKPLFLPLCLGETYSEEKQKESSFS